MLAVCLGPQDAVAVARPILFAGRSFISCYSVYASAMAGRQR